MDPLSVISTGINTSIRLFEVTYQLKAVDEQAADLLSTTKHVDRNVNEARRLRRLKAKLLTTGESTWIDGVIEDTDRALRGVAKLVEPARVDQSTKNSINFGHRVMWVFRDNPQVRDKHQRLSMCHQSLTAVISCLYSKDMVILAPAHESKTEQQQQQPPPYNPEMPSLFEWRRERSRNKSSSNLTIKPLGSPDSFDSEPSSKATFTPASSSFPSPELQRHEAVYPSYSTIDDNRTKSCGDLLGSEKVMLDQSVPKKLELCRATTPSRYEGISSYPELTDQVSATRQHDQAPILPELNFYERTISLSADATPLHQDFQFFNPDIESSPPRPSKVPLENFAVDITSSQCSGLPCDGIEAVPYTDSGSIDRTKSLNSSDMGSVRRGGRGWLAFHAIRSDMGHQPPT